MMSINFETIKPTRLLTAFKKAIDDGHVVTWSYDADGDFTHTPPQWKNRAWLKPSIFAGQLTMNVVGAQGVPTSPEIYAVYHGRFIEAMLAHCDALFDRSVATAMPTNSDIITQAA